MLLTQLMSWWCYLHSSDDIQTLADSQLHGERWGRAVFKLPGEHNENTVSWQDKAGGEVENGLKISFWWLWRLLVLIHGFLPCTFHFMKVNWRHYVLPFCLDLKPARACSSAAWLWWGTSGALPGKCKFLESIASLFNFFFFFFFPPPNRSLNKNTCGWE